MPLYRCVDCQQQVYLMVNREEAKVLCPICTLKRRRQIPMERV